jgi:outer membrane autotransporter protein
MNTLRNAALVVLLILGHFTAGEAQQDTSQRHAAAAHPGFWFSAGGGYVAFGTGCQTCGSPTYRDAYAWYARAGGTLRRGIGLGVEFSSINRGGDTTSARMSVLTLIAQWHPFYNSNGFYLEMGYGFARGRQDYDFNGVSTRTSHGGFGLSFEVGYDIPLGRHFTLTPNVSSIVGALGDIELHQPNGTPFVLKDAIGTGYQFGVAFGFR